MPQNSSIRRKQQASSLRERATRTSKRLPTLTLQVEVRFDSAASQSAFANELSDAVAKLVAKYHDDAAPNGRRFRMIAGVYPAPNERSAP